MKIIIDDLKIKVELNTSIVTNRGDENVNVLFYQQNNYLFKYDYITSNLTIQLCWSPHKNLEIFYMLKF